MFGIQIDYVDREPHPDRVNALRGRDPKTFARLKILGSMTEQSLHSSPGRVRQLDLGRQDGLFAPIQQLILQRLPRLLLLSFATSTTHDDDHNEDHPNHTQNDSKSSCIHLYSPLLLVT